MPLAMRHRHDPTPKFSAGVALSIHREFDPYIMGGLQQRSVAEMASRFANGHRAYLAWVDGEPAAWGWVATRTAEIGEVATTFSIPSGQRYLWNFVTRPEFRGQGIYPRLVDAIVRAEARDAMVFWIAYAPENHASESGIRKAGFVTVAMLSFDETGRPAIKGLTAQGGAAAAQLLGIAESADALSECWRCARAQTGTPSCRTTTCCCDYQKPKVECTDDVVVYA